MALPLLVGFILKVGVAVALSYALRPKPPNVDGQKIDALVSQTSSYGFPLRKVHGADRVAGNVIWKSPLKNEKVVNRYGGKGGGRGKYTTYKTTVSLAVAIGVGEIAGVKRIWANGQVLGEFSTNNDLTGLQTYFIQAATNKSVGAIRVYTGTYTQTTDPLIESFEGAGNTPAYRGIAYVVFEDLSLDTYGKTIPNLEFEIAAGGIEKPVYFTSTSFDDWTSISSVTQTTAYYQKGGMLYVWRNRFNSAYEGAAVFDLMTGTKLFTRGAHDRMYIGDFNDYRYTVVNTGVSLMDYDGDIWAVKLFPDDTGNPIFTHFMMQGIHSGRIKKFSVGDPGDSSYSALVSGYNSEQDCWSFFYARQPYAVETASIVEYRFDLTEGYMRSGSTLYGACDDYALGSGVVYRDKVIWRTSDGSVLTAPLDNPLAFTDLGTIGGWNYTGVGVTETGDLFALKENQSNEFGSGYSRGLQIYEGISLTKKTVAAFEDSRISPIYLEDVVGEVLDDAGLSATDYDVSALSGIEVYGMTQVQPTTAADILLNLSHMYRFDLVEEDWKIVAKLRGGSVAMDLNSDYFLPAGDSGQNEKWVDSITNNDALPYEVTVAYKNINASYQLATERASRDPLVARTTNTSHWDYPVVTDATTAVRAAENILQAAWVNRRTRKIITTQDYLRLSPGDVVTIDGSGRFIVAEISVTAPTIVEMTLIFDSAAAYASTSDGVDPDVVDGDPSIDGTIIPVILDIPLLSTQTNRAGFYIAVGCAGGDWPGAAIYESIDNGLSWEYKAAAPAEAVVGFLNSAAGVGLTSVVDEGTTIRVNLFNSSNTLTSAAEDSVFAGTNTAAIGLDGRWEIISFIDATYVSAGVYDISGLIRGRMGTEQYVGTSENGDMFVLLDASTLTFVDIPEERLDSAMDYKILQPGWNLQDTSTSRYNGDEVVLMPLSGVYGSAEYSVNNVELSWIRRSRLDNGWIYGDISIYEDSESYEIDVYNGSTQGSTLTATTTSLTYTEAEQIADFGSSGNDLTFKIYQMSGTVGRGFPLTVTTSNEATVTAITATINSALIDSTLTDFPVGIALDNSTGFLTGHTADEYNKIKASVGGTQVYCEVDVFEPTNDRAVLWVRVPSVSSSVDTDIILTWEATTQSMTGKVGGLAAPNVWVDYLAVFHMNQDASIAGLYDSTANANDATAYGVSGDLRTYAGFGYAQDIEGLTAGFTTAATHGATGTVEAYCAIVDNGNDQSIINDSWHYGNDYGGLVTFSDSANELRIYAGNSPRSSSTPPSKLGIFDHIAMTTSAATRVLYLNGTSILSDTDTVAGYDTNSDFGAETATGQKSVNGKLAEVRYSSVVRSAAWIKATSNNLHGNLISVS